MIDAKEARRVCDRSEKLSFDKRYPSLVKYVEDKIKYAAMAGCSRVVLELGWLILADPVIKMFDLAEFLRSNGYLISQEDDELLVVSW